jgi:putative ABC transport system permease protein
MRPAWRLATNSLSARPSRTALLIGAVALSAALIAAVACAIASINAALRAQADATVGSADLKISPAGTGKTLDAALLQTVRAWPEVASAEGRLIGALSISITRPVLTPNGGAHHRTEEKFSSQALATGVQPGADAAGPFGELLAGRWPQSADEIVLDAMLAERLSWEYAQGADQVDGFRLGGRGTYVPPGTAEVPESVATPEEARRINMGQRAGLGDEVAVRQQVLGGANVPALAELLSRGPEVRLRVVGIATQPPLGGRPQCATLLDTLAGLTGSSGQLSEIQATLHPGQDPERAASAHQAEMLAGALLQTTSRITSGLDRNIASSELGFVLASVLSFLAAAFIITTGLTTSVTERQRELAILRCIGATRGQLAVSQILIGLLMGVVGTSIGVPAGIGLAWLLPAFFSEQIPQGLTVPPSGVLLSSIGSIMAGVAGAAWPAWRAANQSPLAGVASRAAAPTGRGLAMVTGAGLLGVAVQFAVVGIPSDGQTLFWGYATVGLPAMFIGYFLLGVPAMVIAARLLAGPVSRLLGLPPRLLARTVEATPYRHGFTAGSLMTGLALMIAIWTNGGAILRDWLDKIQFPDAFVSGPSLPPEAQQRLSAMPIVKDTCALTLHPVETDVFGVRALQSYKTTFIAFEPDAFFRMSTLTWVQGDEATAARRLREGGAVIVAREFLIARGLGVGHRFTCSQDGKSHDFEIVGVVASPGLEIISKFFNVGEDIADQALHAVFGSRMDLKEKFGSDAIQLIQIDLADGVDDATAVVAIRKELADYAILDAGSGRQVKEQIVDFAQGMLLVFSAVAIFAMLVACFGVANLIVAGVTARRFEFGVLRAVGAPAGLLGRLVLGEAVLIAAAAAALGSLMGMQASWAGQRLYGLLLGLDLSLRVPWGAMAAGWGIVLAMALGAAGPAAWRLVRQRPRELLGSVRG